MNLKSLTSLTLVVFCIAFTSCSKDDNTVSGSAAVLALACGSSSFSGSAVINIAFTSTCTVPYNGGNGIAYPAGSVIASTGVTGFTATLQAGTLANGNGNLSYTVTGTATSTGTATFAINFGGQSCSFSLPVSATVPILPAVYTKIYGASSITYDGTFVTIKSNGLPDHTSAYYPAGNPLHEAFSGTTFGGSTFNLNPNSISSQNFTFKIPANPVMATTHALTPMGAIGVALNGIPFFNQYAAGGSPLTNEITSFDQWWGHPQMTGVYHYHVEPLYLTTVKATPSSLLGFLLDGFPVYGPQEEGGATPTGLDVYHGHTHITADYPAGIYHYHFTTAAPYLNGNGFYGTAGTVTQ